MNTESRLPYIKPEDMNEKQREFYDFHAEKFKGIPYIWMLEGGELNGPSNALLHDIEIGDLMFKLNRHIVGQTRVSFYIQELVILVTVTAAKAAYGMYAHTKLATEKAKMTPEMVATITAGQRPSNLNEEEAAAYDFAFALTQPGPISGAVYDRALKAFGKEGLSILVFLSGMFKLVGTILNAYNEPVPDYRG